MILIDITNQVNESKVKPLVGSVITLGANVAQLTC